MSIRWDHAAKKIAMHVSIERTALLQVSQQLISLLWLEEMHHDLNRSSSAGVQMEDNGVDFPRPGRAPVRGERPLRAPGYPDVDAMALHGLGLVPMDMSEDEDTDEDDSDEDDNHEEVRLCSLCVTHPGMYLRLLSLLQAWLSVLASGLASSPCSRLEDPESYRGAAGTMLPLRPM